MKVFNYQILLAIPLAALLIASSCTRIVEQDDPSANAVVFSAAAGYEPETRTAFSGEVSGDSQTYERIDWVNGDCIRVYSAEAETAAGAHAADYAVTASSADGVRSLAAVKSSDPLLWGAGTHTFYAVYPAPGSDGADPALSLVDGTAEAVIPATQTLTASGTVWKPDMHYAYMVASARVVSPDVAGPVSLVFRPLVNTFEINLMNFATDPVDSDLQTVRLRSTAEGARLSGGFTATLEADGSYSAAPSGEGSDAVSATFPSGTRLSTSNALTLTLFTLPVALSDLQLELEFANGLVRKLPLADSGAPITVPAGQKIYLDNLTIPDGWIYHIETTTPAAVSASEGGTTSFTVKSYRTKKGVMANESWTMLFSTSPDGPFTDTPPEGFSLSAVSGDGSQVSLNATFAARTTTPVPVDLTGTQRSHFAANSASPYGTQDHPFDLSMHSLISGTSRIAGQPVSANCYVVDRAGWYMFPLVYGNAIDFTVASDASSNQGGNTRAYMPVCDGSGNNSGSSFLTPFQNASGDGMVSPYVLDDVLACGLVDAATLAARDLDAVIVWQDVESGKEIVTHPEILWSKPDASNAESGLACPYIRFQVFENAANYSQGNALIALRDISAAADKANVTPSEAVILWSWHIWVSDISFPADLKKTEIRVSHFDRNYNWMMPADMGYCDPDFYLESTYDGRIVYVKICQTSGYSCVIPFEQSESIVRETRAGTHPYYQFGRKDPLLPADGSSAWRNKHWVSGSGYEVADSEGTIYLNAYQSGALPPVNDDVGLANRYPFVFFHSGSTWLPGKNFTNLWNATCDDVTYGIGNVNAFTDKRVQKTVYDPCPPGFCLPHQNAFTFFTDNGHSISSEHDPTHGVLDPADTPGVDGVWLKCLNDDKGIFFPFAGSRYESEGAAVIYSVKESERFWIPTNHSAGSMTHWCDTRGYMLGLNNRSQGVAVRPIVEEHLIASVPLGD